MTSNFERTHLVSCVDMRSFDSLSENLENNGFRVLVLGGTKDSASLFVEIIGKLPLDPPLSGRVHWDALSDSLSGGLLELGESKVAILWRDTQLMAGQHLDDLLRAVDTFIQVGRLVANPTSDESPITLLLFLLGTGPSFKPLIFGGDDNPNL